MADPEIQWVRTQSAFETAVFWELGARQPRGLHPRVTALLDHEEICFGIATLLHSFPSIALTPRRQSCLADGRVGDTPRLARAHLARR